ncbi:MAG TPA: SMP-30/gluconolactonase/LRE family protein [Jatrophihabitans sp.]|nr:SMP-30/gluconolactonase/LRE family protein [Jatrophihabitans sp.]
MTSPLTVWTAGGYELAEGARWVGERLVFVDILSGRLLEAPTAPGPARVLATLDVPLGAVAPAADGEWIAAVGTGIARLNGDGSLDWLARPEDGARSPARMNDGCCDPRGRFWAGSMAYDGTVGAGSLYRTDPDGTVTQVLDGFTIVNGPAFTADGTRMYVADTPAGRIYQCDVDAESGAIMSQTLFAEVPADDGTPDGMTVDSSGRVWAALWDGAAVRRFEPDGSFTDLPVPAPRPTSVCLADGWLFVTTARYDLPDADAASGAVLAGAVDATAPPACRFGAARR